MRNKTKYSCQYNEIKQLLCVYRNDLINHIDWPFFSLFHVTSGCRQVQATGAAPSLGLNWLHHASKNSPEDCKKAREDSTLPALQEQHIVPDNSWGQQAQAQLCRHHHVAPNLVPLPWKQCLKLNICFCFPDFEPKYQISTGCGQHPVKIITFSLNRFVKKIKN